MRQDHGFTLIELLVVIAVFGLLSVILGNGFQFSQRSIAIGTARLDHSADLTLTDHFIRATLADARPLPDSTTAGDVLFEGKSDSIAFVGKPPAYLAQSGFYADHIGLDDQHNLVFSAETDGGKAERPSILVVGVASAAFAYFGRLPATAAPGWHDSWSHAPGLPNLVRLRMIFIDRTQAPDFVVAIRPTEAAFR